VSPAPESLPKAFGEILAALSAARVPRLKVGADAWGVLRPDKIVAHFPDFETLAASAALLAERLAGLPVHGVPFTAEIGGGGLLSWGADPAAKGASWRSWLCQRLAAALLAARAARATRADTAPAPPPGDTEPWRFAIERLRLEGVDTGTWAPGPLLWRQG
jgi:hypothetical protein